jgi:uncharacterized protein (DUF2336 family)
VNAIALDMLPPVADPHVVRRVLNWMREQPTEGRARAISALARAYLASPLSESLRADALLVMTAALDDSAPQVRRALAEALAGATNAPRHIVMALAADRAEVARPMLAHSPLLDDATLAEAAAMGETSLQIVIAQRHGLSGRALWTLANSGERAAVLALIGNPGAAIDAKALRRIFERFSQDAGVRERLLSRGGLSPSLRVDLALASIGAVTDFGVAREWLDPARAERLIRDAREQAVVRIARGCAADELDELVEHLRERAFLNVALLMRALLSGDLSLFETALASMSGAHPGRVAGFLKQWRGRGFAALYLKSGLPEAFLPAFRAALGALAKVGGVGSEGVSKTLALSAIEECENLRDPALAPVVSLMWRLAGEGARAEARGFAEDATAPSEALLDAPESARIKFDAAPTLHLLALEAVAAALEAPLLDFAAQDEAEGEGFAPLLPPVLAFEGANENFAPAIEIDLDLDFELRTVVAA